jgi:hypothetical protein
MAFERRKPIRNIISSFCSTGSGSLAAKCAPGEARVLRVRPRFEREQSPMR